ncbi:hypothetical protein BLA29_013348, partial [Euroglyphus maynei]
SASDYGAAITSTDYQTGHYIRPKGGHYPKAYLRPKASGSKTVVFTVPQPLPHDDEKHKKFQIPTIEMPNLNKLLPGTNDMMKNSPIKIPAIPGIDLNSLIGNLFGDRDPSHVSVSTPESLGNIIAPMLGHGKPLTINMPNVELGNLGDLGGF